MIERIGRKLHRTGDDDLRGDGVEHLLVLVYDQARHVRHDLTLEELLAHVDLGGDKENVSKDCGPSHTWMSGSHIWLRKFVEAMK